MGEKEDPTFIVTAVINPLSKEAQKLAPILIVSIFSDTNIELT